MNTDIDEQILAALQTVFTYELQTKQANDPLALQTLKQGPLQDDPIAVAPYLVYNPLSSDVEAIRLPTHEEQHIYGCSEIGGPVVYLHFYECKFGTPMTTSRALARHDGATLLSRIVQTLMLYMDLSGVLAPGTQLQSLDETKVIEGSNNRLVTSAGYVLDGGEQTFFTKGRVLWHYPVSWYIPSRTFTGV